MNFAYPHQCRSDSSERSVKLLWMAADGLCLLFDSSRIYAFRKILPTYNLPTEET